MQFFAHPESFARSYPNEALNHLTSAQAAISYARGLFERLALVSLASHIYENLTNGPFRAKHGIPCP